MVVLVHGLWFRAWAMHMLAKRLKRADFLTAGFSYPSRRFSLPELASQLRAFIGQPATRTVHFVGHSMGGLVVLAMLNEFDDLPAGRVVLLGSPVQGSSVARRAAGYPGGGSLFGRSGPTLQQGYSRLPANREVGLIIGDKGVGLGRITGGFDGPSDGTVAHSESYLPGAHGKVILPTTHTGLVWSKRVSRQTIEFLNSGNFLPDDTAG